MVTVGDGVICAGVLATLAPDVKSEMGSVLCEKQLNACCLLLSLHSSSDV